VIPAKGIDQGSLRRRVTWSVLFALLVIAAIAFSAQRTRLIVIHGPADDERSAAAFDQGLMSALGTPSRIDLRSLRVVSQHADPARFCESVLYALRDLAPTLLVAVGGKAQACLLKSPFSHSVPALLVGGARTAAPAQRRNVGVVAPELPAQTWSEALLSQVAPGGSYRVLFLAADTAAGSFEQEQFGSLRLPGIAISTRLVTSWPEWRAAVQQAAHQFDLLIISQQSALENLPGADPRENGVVAQTRAIFGSNIAATKVGAVADGAAWAIEPEPYSIGVRAANAGLSLLNQTPGSALPPQTILIAVNDSLDSRQRPPLPQLFEVVARYQGLFLSR
jgi:hypothetical protein